jgi:hypothetical protein
MAFNMTAGMTLWMRRRRHSWAMCAEMAGAMFVPAIAAIVLYWSGLIDGRDTSPTAQVPKLFKLIYATASPDSGSRGVRDYDRSPCKPAAREGGPGAGECEYRSSFGAVVSSSAHGVLVPGRKQQCLAAGAALEP